MDARSLPSASLNLTFGQKALGLLVSFGLVAFGQPAWSWWLGLMAATVGFACFWRVLLAIPEAKERFCIAMGWFAGVQVIQLSWFPSHPYAYIYGVLLFCAWVMGAQFGFLALGIQPQSFRHPWRLVALAGLWTLLEWSRLFILSGLPFNPVGLSLTGALYPLQLASLGGVYGLSFLVMLTNLFVLRAWIDPPKLSRWALACALIALPYGFGLWHVKRHEAALSRSGKSLSVVLVQTALPIEENLGFQSAEEARQFVLNEWQGTLLTLQKQMGKTVDLIVFPENLVPYGTYYAIFPLDQVQGLLSSIFGSSVEKSFPSLQSALVDWVWTDQGPKWLASNAYIAQTVANFFNAHLVIGLEDNVYVDQEQKRSQKYSAAFHFAPGDALPSRYEKRILVPMGEYIPFEWCRNLVAKYGITGSFDCGQTAKVFAGPVPFGASICYEEIYGHLMRENRQQGAELLVNLTNDGWFPNSRLPKQHFDHARLRTVENGIPLARSCNTGITCVVDSLGRVIGTLAEDHMQAQEVADSLQVDLPLYHYATFYSQFGDWPVLGLALLSLAGWASGRRKVK